MKGCVLSCQNFGKWSATDIPRTRQTAECSQRLVHVDRTELTISSACSFLSMFWMTLEETPVREYCETLSGTLCTFIRSHYLYNSCVCANIHVSPAYQMIRNWFTSAAADPFLPSASSDAPTSRCIYKHK